MDGIKALAFPHPAIRFSSITLSQKIEKKQMKSARVSNRVPERESKGERGRVRGERSRDQVNKVSKKERKGKRGCELECVPQGDSTYGKIEKRK